jgi:hypothetical protein
MSERPGSHHSAYMRFLSFSLALVVSLAATNAALGRTSLFLYGRSTVEARAGIFHAWGRPCETSRVDDGLIETLPEKYALVLAGFYGAPAGRLIQASVYGEIAVIRTVSSLGSSVKRRSTSFVIPLLLGLRAYERSKGKLGFMSVGIGVCCGYQPRIELNDAWVSNSRVTLVPCARLELGVQFPLGKDFLAAMGIGVNFSLKFGEQIAGMRRWNGFELTFGLGHVQGRGWGDF